MAIPLNFAQAFGALAAALPDGYFVIEGRVFKTAVGTPLTISYLNLLHAVALGFVVGENDELTITTKGRKFASAVNFAKTGKIA